MHELTYSENGYLLTIRESSGADRSYDIVLSGKLHGCYMLEPKVKLLAVFESHRQRLYIEDVQGNGYKTGIQAQGIGTLLFNTALQLFKRDYPSEMLVYGELSEIGDPTDPVLAKECKDRRESYWSSFGFTIGSGGYTGTTITAVLGELKPKTQDVRIHGQFPRYVALERFIDANCP